jgi:hypothetical protein
MLMAGIGYGRGFNMRSVAIAVFMVCTAGAAQASSLVYFKEEKPASTPSVLFVGIDGQQATLSSVISMGEAQPPVTGETVSAIPVDRGPESAPMVIRDGVVGSALPRHMTKPAVAQSTNAAKPIPAKADGKLPASGKLKPEALR